MGEESTPDAIGQVRSAAGAVAEILKVAKTNPEAAEAGRTAAKSLNVLSTSLFNMLMPLRVLNYGAAKVEAYFATKFGEELGAKLADVAPEEIVEPKTYIAGPVIQGIADTVEEPDLRGMYTSLLARAMSEQTADRTHPSYAEIIKQLSPHEVQGLRVMLRSQLVPVVSLISELPGGGHIPYERHLTQLFRLPGDYNPELVQMAASWVENWKRLGLIDLDYANHFSHELAYDWVESRAEYIHREAHIASGSVLGFKKGMIRRTDFGVGFAEAAGILPTTLMDGSTAVMESPSDTGDPVED